MSKENIRNAKLSAQLAKPDRREALGGAASVVITKVETATVWYEKSIADKRRGAVLLRLGAIVLGTEATLTPLVLSVIPDTIISASTQKTLLPIAAILGVVAAACILVDKFFGFSSRWMDYVTTYQDLQARREVFEIEWAKRAIAWSTPVADAEYAAALDALCAFLQAVNQTVKTETCNWVVEFKGALAKIDETVGEQRSAAVKAAQEPRTGGISVTLDGLEKLDGQTWKLQLGKEAALSRTGTRTAALVDVAPGVHRVVASARLASADVSDEKPVTVEAGKVASVSFKLGA